MVNSKLEPVSEGTNVDSFNGVKYQNQPLKPMSLLLATREFKNRSRITQPDLASVF